MNDITEFLNKAEDLLEKVNNYRQIAGAIDHRVKCQSENYVPLDSLPYGEEMIRTSELTEQLTSTIDSLENDNVSKEGVENAMFVIEDAEQTLADCKDLPVNIN
jgi:hypothetical protein